MASTSSAPPHFLSSRLPFPAQLACLVRPPSVAFYPTQPSNTRRHLSADFRQSSHHGAPVFQKGEIVPDKCRDRSAYSNGLSRPGTSWMVRRPFDGGSPRGNQYFHASKGWAPSTRPTSLKGVLGDDGVQLAAAFREQVDAAGRQRLVAEGEAVVGDEVVGAGMRAGGPRAQACTARKVASSHHRAMAQFTCSFHQFPGWRGPTAIRYRFIGSTATSPFGRPPSPRPRHCLVTVRPSRLPPPLQSLAFSREKTCAKEE